MQNDLNKSISVSSGSPQAPSPTFTRGPWSVVPVNGQGEREGYLGKKVSFYEIEGADEGYVVAVTLNDAPELETQEEANARLIAAAPDLFEALKPFAMFANTFDAPGAEYSTRPKSGEFYTITMRYEGRECDFTLTVEQFKAARAALSKALPQ